jgi:transposase
LKNHLALSELKQKLVTQTDIRIFKQWQILNAVAGNPGTKAAVIASLLGTTPTIVRRYVRLYNKHGSEYLSHLQWGGRREARSNLTFSQEEDLLQSIAAKSLKGEILTARDIRKEVEKKVKRSVSEDYLWDLFKRHGWKKKAPRPKHPLQDIAAQDLFKKNSPMFWQPTL